MKSLFLAIFIIAPLLSHSEESLLGKLGEVDVQEIQPSHTPEPPKEDVQHQRSFRLSFSCTDNQGKKHKNGTHEYDDCMRKKMDHLRNNQKPKQQTETFTIQFGN